MVLLPWKCPYLLLWNTEFGTHFCHYQLTFGIQSYQHFSASHQSSRTPGLHVNLRGWYTQQELNKCLLCKWMVLTSCKPTDTPPNWCNDKCFGLRPLGQMSLRCLSHSRIIHPRVYSSFPPLTPKCRVQTNIHWVLFDLIYILQHSSLNFFFLVFFTLNESSIFSSQEALRDKSLETSVGSDPRVTVIKSRDGRVGSKLFPTVKHRRWLLEAPFDVCWVLTVCIWY